MTLFGPDYAVLTRLDRVERKLNQLLQHFSIEESDDGLDEVRTLAVAGEKIAAIKLHRKLTSSGLAEAKEWVESEIGRRRGV